MTEQTSADTFPDSDSHVDPNRPVEGRWPEFLCALGWHRRFIHPLNIWFEGETCFAYSTCCGCGDVELR